MVMVMVVMVQPGQASRRAGRVLVMVVQPEHEAGRGGIPVMVARRRVQLAAPRGHGVQLAAAADSVVAADAAATAAADADVTDDVTAAATQRAQRRLPWCRDRGVGVAAGRAACPVAGAGHCPSVFVRRHHRDVFRAHRRRPIRRVRQRACAVLRTVGRRCGAIVRYWRGINVGGKNAEKSVDSQFVETIVSWRYDNVILFLILLLLLLIFFF